MDSGFIDLLRRQLKVDAATEIAADSPLRDLGMDSMRSIELLFTIEDTYGVTLPDSELNETVFGSPGTLWAAVAAQLSPEQVAR